VRRYSEWDTELLVQVAPALAEPDSADDELLLCNTYLNSQPVPEDVIIAAAVEHAAAAGARPHGSRARLCAVCWGARGPGTAARPSSASRRGGAGGGNGAGGGVSWIDDHARVGTAHKDVPISPGPGAHHGAPRTASYNSLAVGVGWADSAGTTVTVPAAGGGTVTTRIVPTATGSVSAAAVEMPRARGRGQPQPPAPQVSAAGQQEVGGAELGSRGSGARAAALCECFGSSSSSSPRPPHPGSGCSGATRASRSLPPTRPPAIP